MYLKTSAGDPWYFFASSEREKTLDIGGQTVMADGTLRKWLRTTKRRWTIGIDILERSDKWMILRMADELNNLSFKTDEMDAEVSVQLDISQKEFTRLKSDEILYTTTIGIMEA